MSGKWMRTRYVALRCQSLGRGAIVDMFKVRMLTLRRRIAAWAEVMLDYRKSHDTRMVMIMLTYRRVGDYRPGHINAYMKSLKQSLGKNLIAFAWVAELQQRGAMHYHLVLIVERGTRIPMPDKSGMWSHGWSGTRTARTPYYLLKYCGKEYQKDLSRYPRGARLYAASVRTPEGSYAHDFRALAGLTEDASGAENADGDERPAWEYAGSSVGYEYASDVLLSGLTIK